MCTTSRRPSSWQPRRLLLPPPDGCKARGAARERLRLRGTAGGSYGDDNAGANVQLFRQLLKLRANELQPNPTGAFSPRLRRPPTQRRCRRLPSSLRLHAKPKDACICIIAGKEGAARGGAPVGMAAACCRHLAMARVPCHGWWGAVARRPSPPSPALPATLRPPGCPEVRQQRGRRRSPLLRLTTAGAGAQKGAPPPLAPHSRTPRRSSPCCL